MRRIVLLMFLLLTSCAASDDNSIPHPELMRESCDADVVNVLKLPRGSANFYVSRSKPTNADFYINSNFFDSRGPIGELIVKGKRISSRARGGGYFFVKGGVPGVSAYVPPRGAEYSSQSILVAINDGKVNSALTRRAHAKESTYRSLVGVDRAGSVYILATGRKCIVTISEMISYGQRFKLREAILPDAASSVDYKLSDGESEVSMKAIPGPLKQVMRIEEPKSYILGQLRR